MVLLLSSIGRAWNSFFHARVGPQACKLGGWMRIAYAFMFAMDRLIMARDVQWLYLSGRLPFEYESKGPTTLSLFQLAPESHMLFWFIYITGFINSVLLLLGIQPRLQLVLMHLNLMSFENYNELATENESVMFRMWCFFLLFLPLDRFSLREWWEERGLTKQQKQEKHSNDSWPMWPFRMWQLEMCLVYVGAGYGKLAGEVWRNGTALYYAAHVDDFWGGAFTPDFLYNNMASLKFLCWSSLVLECLCIFTVWIKPLKIPTVVSMILLHIGIELAMNMHLFQWMTILGWCSFFVEPLQEEDNNKNTNAIADHGDTNTLEEHNGAAKQSSSNGTTTVQPSNGQKLPTSDKKPSSIRRILINLFLIFILPSFFMDTMPQDALEEVTPSVLEPLTNRLWTWRNTLLYDSGLRDALVATGLDQQAWTVYQGKPDHTNVRLKATIRYQDGSTKIWNSPDWSTMPWWQRKGYVWQMGFYKNIDESVPGSLHGWSRAMAKEEGPGVTSIHIEKYEEVPPDPPADLGLFDPAKQPMIGEWFSLIELNICDDLKEECQDWANENQCEENTSYMIAQCRRSCGFCYDVQDIKVGSRIALYFDDEETEEQPPAYYEATVLEIKSPSFLIKYNGDEYPTWVDKTALYEQSFLLLNDDDEDGDQYSAGSQDYDYEDEDSSEQEEETPASDEL